MFYCMLYNVNYTMYNVQYIPSVFILVILILMVIPILLVIPECTETLVLVM